MDTEEPELLSFGELIRKLRKLHDLSQTKFGDRIWKSRGTIYAWEKGLTVAETREDVLAIAAEFALSALETDKLLYAAHYPSEYQTPNIASHLRKDPQEAIRTAFSFGPFEVPYIILEGNGEATYSPENIVIHYDESLRLELPSELERIKLEVEAREAAKKEEGKPYNWNGPITFMDRWSRSRTIKGEHLALELWFGLTDFYTFTATNMSLHKEQVFDPKTGRIKTLYEKYFATYDWSDPFLKPQRYFSNIFGVVIALITGDEKLIIGRRPSGVGARAGVLNIAINESVHPEKDLKKGGLIDIYRTAKRGTKEELGFHLTDLKFFAFGIDSEYSMWNLLGIARTDQSADEVIKGRLTKAIDKFEIHSIYKVQFEPRSVVEFIDSTIAPAKRHSVSEVWSPGALTCIYYALVNSFKQDYVDRVITAYFR